MEDEQYEDRREEKLRVWVFRDQDDEDVGGIRNLTRDYQLKRDPTFDDNQTAFHFAGVIFEQGRDYTVAEFVRVRSDYLGQGAS